jgi:hypothetical protein
MIIRYHSSVGFDSAISSTIRFPRSAYKDQLPPQFGLHKRLTSLRKPSNAYLQKTLKRSEILRSRLQTGTVEIWAAAAILFAGLAGLAGSVFDLFQG